MTSLSGQLLRELRILEWSDDPAARFCGLVLAQLGASVTRLVSGPGGMATDGDPASLLLEGFLDSEKSMLQIPKGQPLPVLSERYDLAIADHGSLEAAKKMTSEGDHRGIVLCISPYGLSEPAVIPAWSSLILQHASGLAYQRSCPVSEPERNPPVGTASYEAVFVAGVGAAGAALSHLISPAGRALSVIDFSVRDYIAHLLIDPIASFNAGSGSGRKRDKDQPIAIAGGLVWLLPCVDGLVLVSPREDHQWTRWVELLGYPVWALEPGLCGSVAERARNYSRLQHFMGTWSRSRDKQEVFTSAQTVRVPCFPVSLPVDIISNEQLASRDFLRTFITRDGASFKMPSLPFQVKPFERPGPSSGTRTTRCSPARPPDEPTASIRPGVLNGVRVIDFSWVMAGPMATKALALLGAEVIKIESATRPEFLNRGGWFDIINNGKKSCALNLRKPEARRIVHSLVQVSDILVENFSSGVLDRYALGVTDVEKINPELIYVSASGLGRSGPQSHCLAYGTLLQAYSGHSGLVGPPNEALEAMGIVPAWTDPVTSAFLVLAILSALKAVRRGQGGMFIDLSMLESTVSLMPDILIRAQLGLPQLLSNQEPRALFSGCFRCAGEDDWLALAATNETQVRFLYDIMGGGVSLEGSPGSVDTHCTNLSEAISRSARGKSAAEWEAKLRTIGIAAVRSRSVKDLLTLDDVRLRGLFPTLSNGSRTVGLPWSSGEGRPTPAIGTPALGADTEHVLSTLINLPKSVVRQLQADEVIV